MALAVYKHCNPYIEENQSYRSFVICGEYIKISQDKKKGIGFTLWDCVIFTILTFRLLFYLIICKIFIKQIFRI